MASGTTGSLNRGQIIDFQTSNPLKGVAVKKQTLLAGAVLLAIFIALAAEFRVHADGQANGATTSSVKAAASQESEIPAPVSDAPSSGTGSTAGSGNSGGSSVNIQYNSSSTTSSNPANNSSSSSLLVNGQKVPTSGDNVNEHYTSTDGSTNVNISSTSSSNAGGQSQ